MSALGIRLPCLDLAEIQTQRTRKNPKIKIRKDCLELCSGTLVAVASSPADPTYDVTLNTFLSLTRDSRKPAASSKDDGGAAMGMAHRSF